MGSYPTRKRTSPMIIDLFLEVSLDSQVFSVDGEKEQKKVSRAAEIASHLLRTIPNLDEHTSKLRDCVKAMRSPEATQI